MALLPTKQRDQVMVLVTILAVAIVGLFWYFVYDPKSTDLDKLAAHVDTLDDMNQKAKAEMAKGTVEQIREQARESRENLDLMRTLVPAANEVSSLIDQVSTAARRAKLDIGSLEPEPLIEGELFDTYRYRLKMCGAYNDIGHMLTNIGSLNRIVTAINLQLTPPVACPASPPGKQMVTASFVIQTYVVRTAPKKRPAKKPADAAPGAPAGATPPPAPAGAPPAKKPGGEA
ncbi:MAG TPA: type 4a pilus biogenesis protein PilO [Gemmatimonadaceae bacterium]|jgi:type IV pilus assembly protein PilO|nr:type 4a pilus biogenesis protein PilO [Gemmatimonadaceae bacterium]